MRWKNKAENPGRYSPFELSIILSSMQAGNNHRRNKIEDGSQRRARRLKRRACFSKMELQALFAYYSNTVS